jgi:predicted TIM-barrel fold metal-dependent hydrolase
MTSQRGAILADFLNGGPLSAVDVVDCHVHLGPALYMQNPDTSADGLVGVLDSIGISIACVSHSVAMVSDWRLGNSLLIEAVKKYPGRIFGYAFFNPRYPDQMDAEMARCSAAGLRGLKMHPDFHNMPANSPLYDPLYERAQAEQRLILCHYGAGPSPRCGTHVFRDVVRRFPHATYIMAHSLPGAAAVDAACEYFKDYDVYFDLANAFQPGVIEYACSKLGVDRLLYGSDGCWGSIATRVGLICATDLPDGDKRRILGTNMRELITRNET